jgi:ADP-heptose:LPS heptosyltransferase
LVGAAPAALEPTLSVRREDRDRARHLLRPFGDDERPLLTLHAGASDPRRRWPTGWFGEVAARAAANGWRVVVVGEEHDGRLARDLIGQAVSRGADCRRILDLTGRTDLSALVGVIGASDAVVGNDSGPLHLAEAIGTPSVGIFWVGGSITSAPLSRAHHRVHIGWTTSCPVCGRDATQALWTGERCEHEPSYVTAVPVDPVWDDLVDLVDDSPRGSDPLPGVAFDPSDTGAFDPRDLDDY